MNYSSGITVVGGRFGGRLLAASLMLWLLCGWAVKAGESATNAPPSSSAGQTNAGPSPSLVATNGMAPVTEEFNEFNARLASAIHLEKTGQFDVAEPILIGLLADVVPEAVRQSALFEMGGVIRSENDLPRAMTVCAQFLDRWPNDPRVPEVLLRQGQMYRQMGLNNLALTKFYAVMTAALSLKSDRPEYYPGLVLEAQMEIAETHYLMGRFADAADFYSRLLKQGNPALNRPQAQFRLIHSLTSIGRNDEAVSQSRDFLGHFPNAAQQPEVRFHLAQALKQLGQNNEALQQVLLLLKEEKARTKDHPEIWAYWQQRAGNEVANQLYREGDYLRALEIYLNLSELDPAPAWQLPVKYQIGLTYERLQQPQKAADSYHEILKLETAINTNATPGQKAIFDMARWRAGFLGWQGRAEISNRSIASAARPAADLNTNATTGTAQP